MSLDAARYQDALDFLWGRINYERSLSIPYDAQRFKLDRMRTLLDRLGSPDAGLPIVHIAGTKGKGSTAAMVAAVLQAAGWRTGLFTSPHLDRIEQRMAVGGEPCEPHELIELIEAVRPAVERLDREHPNGGPTFFELNTALALCHFRQRAVDAAVLEVGLGGRLDSTNVCQPLVSVITSISLDHVEQLGPTLTDIAREKAGIIKPDVPVVSGVLADEPRRVIEETCRQRRAPLVQLGRDFDYTYHAPQPVNGQPSAGRIDFHRRTYGGGGDARDLPLALLGRHQAANAAVAAAAIDQLVQLGWAISEAALRSGLANTSCAARVQVVRRQPTVVLDTAHNVASVDALLAALDEHFPPSRRTLLFATSGDKDLRGMVERLLPRFERLIFTRYGNNPRAASEHTLAAIANELGGQSVVVCSNVAQAWRTALADCRPDDLICIAGSFFLAAEIRQIWQGEAAYTARGGMVGAG